MNNKKQRNRLFTMLLLVMALLIPQCGWAQTQPSGGDGSSESPFLITTAEELKWYASYVNGESGDNVVHTTACAQLMNDIDLSTVCGEGKDNWMPIAKNGIYKYNGEYRFDGVFDGNGHTISNLYINDQDGSCFGLLGHVEPTTKKTSVKNLKMASVQIVGKTDIAAVCASGYNATFENIEVISGSIAGFSDIYGISGCRGSVKKCINRADVTASTYNAAGVISTIQDEASNCSNYGKITTGTGWAGGIAGGSDGMTTILINCANYGEIHVTGTVNSSDCAVGGLLGSPWNIEISNCANFGNIYLKAQSDFVGTIAGTNQLMKASGILANTGNIYVDGVAQTDVPVLQSGIKWFDNNVDNTAKCLTPTAEQLASGWLTWQLQQNCSTQTWGQNISTDPKDQYPVLGSDYKIIRAAQGDKDANDNDTYWATFSNQTNDVTLSVPSDRTLNVYNATVSGGKMTLTQRNGNQVAKEEGVLLKTDGEYVNAKANEINGLTKVSSDDNHLVATPAETQTVTAETGYKLYRLTYNNAATKKGLGFYLSGSNSSYGTSLKATPGKAYLQVSENEAKDPSSASLARSFVFGSGNETTGIEGITIIGTDVQRHGTLEGIFDLQGRKISNPTKGIYIKNNKKVIIK